MLTRAFLCEAREQSPRFQKRRVRLYKQRSRGPPGFRTWTWTRTRTRTMPAPRRASLLGRGPAERLVPAGSCTRVTRRALGVSSVFLQGTRSSAAPVIPKTGLGSGLGSGLGWTLVDYRDKVQTLERLNSELEQQIRAELQQRSHSASSWEPLREQWEQEYRQVSEEILSNARLLLQTENVQNKADDFKDRLEAERPWREEVQEEISALLKVSEEASQTQEELQRRTSDLWAELQQLQQLHRQDVRRLYTEDLQLPDFPWTGPDQTGLDQVLDHIRAHWDRVCEERVQNPPHTKVSDPEFEELKTEVQEAASKVQSLQVQTESLRVLKRGLEATLADARRWQQVELQSLNSLVSGLDSELNQVQTETESQRRDLETLLSNKSRLEQEVQLYQHLLQGEENRYRDLDQDQDSRTTGTQETPEQQCSLLSDPVAPPAASKLQRNK